VNIHHEVETPTGWVLLLHGGAGEAATTDARMRRQESSLAAAQERGAALLAAGGSALDAVEASVRYLEECGDFNAGRGAVRDASGAVTLDAAVMDGPGRRAGAVAALAPVASPIAVARLVMERSPHVLLAGSGALEFAAKHGHPALATPMGSGTMQHGTPSSAGTVGAVARDAAGRLAAATSTGGLSGKLPGRVGDSPVIGAGTWADQRIAVSATGAGECFVRTAFAHQVASLALSRPLPDAVAAVLGEVRGLGGDGGALVITSDGPCVLSFITPAMPRAFATASRRWVAPV
jgi:L-asparaginase / beta-aspartyl-peptidase